jgi:hypothetical protein
MVDPEVVQYYNIAKSIVQRIKQTLLWCSKISATFYAVHTSSRQHNILYLGLDIGPLILHTNSRQGKNASKILDSNSRQKKISVIESTVTKVRFNDESSMF